MNSEGIICPEIEALEEGEILLVLNKCQRQRIA